MANEENSLQLVGFYKALKYIIGVTRDQAELARSKETRLMVALKAI